jgi:molybdopterin converting factor small subunit
MPLNRQEILEHPGIKILMQILREVTIRQAEDFKEQGKTRQELEEHLATLDAEAEQRLGPAATMIGSDAEQILDEITVEAVDEVYGVKS